MFIRVLNGAGSLPQSAWEEPKGEFVTARVSIEVHGRKQQVHKELNGRSEVVC
jgi:hypothetical protein